MADDLNQVKSTGEFLPPEPPPEPAVSLPTEPPPPSLIIPPPGKKRSRLKLILGLGALFLLAASIPAAVFLVQQRQEIRERAAEECSNPPGNEGDWRYECTQNTCPTDPSAGVGIPYQCEGGSWVNKNPAGECTTQCEPGKQYTSCASWDYQNDPTCTADPTCQTDPNKNGFCCLRAEDNRAVCCYRDGACQEGQQGRCTDNGQGSITTQVEAEIREFHCPQQTSATGVCSENVSSRGRKPAGTYTVDGGCGGHQIEAIGLCGSYKFNAPCAAPPSPTPPPLGCFYCLEWGICAGAGVGGQTPVFPSGCQPTCRGNWVYKSAGDTACQAQRGQGYYCWECEIPSTPTPPTYSCECLQIKVYDTGWNLIQNPNTIQAGQTIRLAVLGQTNHPQGITKARIRVNNAGWQETTTKKSGTNEFYLEYTISSTGGSFTVEGEVYNPVLGWK